MGGPVKKPTAALRRKRIKELATRLPVIGWMEADASEHRNIFPLTSLFF